MKNRWIKRRIEELSRSNVARILVLTGARQTGKTTLIKQILPDWRYISLEDPLVRPSFSALTALDWITRYPRAILDEVQKVPALIESIKASNDLDDHVRYVLLGSSQILLLSKVKESLAGRVIIQELYPLTLPEVATSSWDDSFRESRFLQWLRAPEHSIAILDGVPATAASFARCKLLFETYLQFGGMPSITNPDFTDEEKKLWLRNYQQTYLQRDLADLAQVRDLEPFVLAQKHMALRSGKLVNFSDLARNAQIAPQTAKRFVRYLELSYQVISIPPYFRNIEKRLSKSHKLYFLDPGVWRGTLDRWDSAGGEEFESAVVCEIWKQIKNAELPISFYHLRTFDGREVDLLLETAAGFVGIEVKQAGHVSAVDARHFTDVEQFLDKPFLMGFIVSNDLEIKRFGEKILALPAPWLLGTN